MSLTTEQQLAQLKTKYDNEVKKNNNLLKMNSNLMKENQLYQKCFSMLKKWKHSLFNQFKTDDQTIEDNSIDWIDIEDEGEQFVQQLTSAIQRKLHQDFKSKHDTSHIKTQRNQSEQNITIQEKECNDCQRWKQLYTKQTKETSRLQKIIDESSIINTQKQINIIKLKDDIRKLLNDYLVLYKNQLGIMQQKQKTKYNIETEKITNRQTVRIRDTRSKEKRSGSSGNKSKKVILSTNSIKQQNMFIKDKNSKNIKYAIQLSPKQANQKNSQILEPILLGQFSQKFNAILNSYSNISNSFEQENYLLKEKLREFHQILVIYREKQRNRFLYK